MQTPEEHRREDAHRQRGNLFSESAAALVERRPSGGSQRPTLLQRRWHCVGVCTDFSEVTRSSAPVRPKPTCTQQRMHACMHPSIL